MARCELTVHHIFILELGFVQYYPITDSQAMTAELDEALQNMVIANSYQLQRESILSSASANTAPSRTNLLWEKSCTLIHYQTILLSTCVVIPSPTSR